MDYLAELSKYIRALEPTLATMVYDDIPFAILGESDGDACLFNGLLASVHDESKSPNWPLVAVIMSQGENGMFYRSPRRRGTDNAGYEAFFSRDQSCGVLLAATKKGFPLESWSRWIRYIDLSRPCLVRKPKWMGGGCMIHSPVYYYAPDDRSAISPECWAMMGRVARFRGWPQHNQMDKWLGFDGDASVIEAQNCEVGFQLHLKVVDAFIKMLIKHSRAYSQKVGEVAFEKVPDNLFYEFMATRCIDNAYIKKFIDIAPPIDTKWGNGWVWQESSVAKELPYSSGWDFLFLGKMILHFCR